MSQFLKHLAELYRTATDRAQNSRPRLEAAFALFALFLAPIALIAAVTIFARYALPYLVGGLFLLVLFGGDAISDVVNRHRESQAQQAALQEQQTLMIWRQVAINAVIPALATITGVRAEPEELVYGGPFGNGPGLYYATPELMTDPEQRRALRRLIINKLAGNVNKARQQLYGFVLCEADHIFIDGQAFG